MRVSRAGDVVRVRFPYTDRATRQRRPALVVSKSGIGEGGALLWVAMITTADNRGWSDDIEILEPVASTGLPIPSIVRPTKVATVDTADAERIGGLEGATLEKALDVIRSHLGPAA